jgi:hypothetical protein
MDDVEPSEKCGTCEGAGEVGTDYGVVDCPDCGGSGELPPEGVLVEWRLADIDRRVSSGKNVDVNDVPWLLSELRKARSALKEVVGLAHDAEDEQRIDQKIRFVANKALGLYRHQRVDD